MEPQRYGPFPYTPINRRPKITWPDGKRLALWVIPNIETFPLNEPVPGGTGMAPDIINWAPRDYGARVGVFRIMEVLARHGVRGTVTLNSEVCDDYPEIIEDAPVVIDGNIVTSRGAGTATDFGLTLVELLCSESLADEVATSICVPENS